MRHHLRTDKTCLNCGTTVEERFCTHCGQENIETKESFGHLLRHFFEDVTHYDSKFFVTIRDLLIKPGFLTAQYLSGKRASYLHPIRNYLFISFVYFLFIFSTSHFGIRIEKGLTDKASYDAREHVADSIRIRIAQAQADTSSAEGVVPTLRSVLPMLRLPQDSVQDKFNFTLIGQNGLDYRYLLNYDSVQKALPPSERETGIKAWYFQRSLHTMELYGIGVLSMVVEKTQHVIPKLMFLLMPLFALMLMFLYRKKFLYVDHAIFTLHFHSAIFLLFLIVAIVSYFVPGWKTFLNFLEFPLIAIYLLKALRVAYQQSWGINILKSIVLTVLYLVFLLVGTFISSLIFLL